MKQAVIWQNSDGQSNIVWRRKGEVTLNFVQVEPKVNRNSISSVPTVSKSPIAAHTVESTLPYYKDSPMISGSEIPQQRGAVLLNSTPKRCSLDRLQAGVLNLQLGASIPKSDQQEEEMFQLIKAHCSQNPILYKKVVDWGRKNKTGHFISPEREKNLSKGKIWLTVQTLTADEGRAMTDRLDDIKGAYQEVTTGVYKQPHPEACGSEAQHRLIKQENGRWIVERQCKGQEDWQVRAQQLDHGQWVDLKNNKMTFQAQLVPLRSILEGMGLQESKYNLKKKIDFLFNSCNQAKLCNLKGRSLKHHITNLKQKLEKRNALNLGVLIANAAKSIIQESQSHANFSTGVN